MTTEIICELFHSAIRKLPRNNLADLPNMPSDGIYVLFESNETGHKGDRIVRIGSHTGDGNLRARLREHTTLNKDRSIFRKHVGRAILRRDNDPYLSTWNLDLTSKKTRDLYGTLVDTTKQAAVEDAVSRYIASRFSVAVFGAKSPKEACELEKLCIGTVSSCTACGPTHDWLGGYADKRIAQSGLWQIMHLYKTGLEIADLEAIQI